MRKEERASTGIEGLDSVLGGGLPVNRLYLVHGRPGVGKTTFALQFLRAGVQSGETTLYVGLSESEEELAGIASSHGWTLDGIDVCDLQAQSQATPPENESQYTFFHPSEIELHDTTRLVLETLNRVNPSRIVFDSLSELRLMARDSLRYRRQILSLKDYLAKHDATILLLDTRLAQGSGEFQLETLAHGVIAMEEAAPDYGGARRRLRVSKLRGLPFVEGFHDYQIETGGIRVYPRLVPLDYVERASTDVLEEEVSSGIPELDRLCGGGLEPGTTTIFLGPAGVGKSTLVTQYCIAALRRGEGVGIFHFDEGAKKWWRRARWLDPEIDSVIDEDNFCLRQINPAEMSPGEFADMLRAAVDEMGASVVVIDSVNGYAASMPEEAHLNLHLHELFSYLNDRNVLTLITSSQHGFVGDQLQDPSKLSYLADNVFVLRYFEAFGLLRKAIALVKKRTGAHERFIREFHLGDDGLRVGAELRAFQGILGGELVYDGEEQRLIGEGERGREAHLSEA